MNKISTYIIVSVAFISLLSCNEKQDKAMNLSEQLQTTLEQNAILFEEAELELLVSAPDFSTPELQLNYMRESEDWDKYETGILPQMTEDAPEYSKKILESDGKRFIIVDKAKMKLFLYDPHGNIEKSYGIACAKNYGTKKKKGDSRTTEGCFEVKGVFDSTNWLFTDDNGYTSPTRGQYGPRFIRLSIPYIGIHGTGNPGSIGRRCSHGCIRVTNPNILELVELVEPGMAVIISPGPRDMAVNEREGSKILSVSTEPGSPKAVPGNWVEPVTEKAQDTTSQEEDSTPITSEETIDQEESILTEEPANATSEETQTSPTIPNENNE